MASNDLINVWESYKKYYDRHGVDEKLINYSVQAAKVAIGTENDIPYGLEITAQTKKFIDEFVLKGTQGGNFWALERYAQKNKTNYSVLDYGYEIYKLEAFHRFESFLIYMEKKRPYEKRFYLPRACTQRTVAYDLQRLENDELDVYGLSEPSRTGKSTMCVFFLTWVGLRKPTSHNAMGGHSGQLAKRFFRGLNNLIDTPEYTFEELFTEAHPEMNKVIESKSSDPAEFTINLGVPDEFSTFTCRGIDGTWTGAIDVSPDGYLYVDDLVRDREHSLSPSRMENTWQEYQNKMLDRMNDGAKKILVGTLWSTIDPLEREKKLNEDNPRAFFRKIPALDENDNSNFQYEIKGFSSQYYINMRERLDKAEWMAKFQQTPFVREGLSYPIEELRFFDGSLPDGKCRTIAIIDPAFGKGDNLSMPICKDFGDDRYIIAWIHDKSSPGITIPRIVDAIDRYYITHVWIEKNAGGGLFSDKLQEEMDARGVIHCKLELYAAPERMHKEDKIAGYSDYVKRKFLFLTPKAAVEIDDGREIYRADGDYRKALDEMTTWSAEGKGKVNDDAPDAISSLAMKMDARKSKKTAIMHSPI